MKTLVFNKKNKDKSILLAQELFSLNLVFPPDAQFSKEFQISVGSHSQIWLHLQHGLQAVLAAVQSFVYEALASRQAGQERSLCPGYQD